MADVEHLALVPGSGCDGRLFASQIDGLRTTARIHVIENTEHARIDGLARAALDRLPERFALAGLSQGGLVGLEIIRQAPERVSGLALLDTLPYTGCVSTGSGTGWRSPCSPRGRSVRPLLPQIAVPTLVLVGDQDTLAPVEAAVETAAAIPYAALVTVPGSGHLTTLEAPAAVTTALRRWLERVRRHADTPAAATEPSTPRTAP